MLGKSPNQAQNVLFGLHFESVLNKKNTLLLANKINWSYLEQEFSCYTKTIK